MFNDLREFIRKAEELGEYQLIEGADWDLEIGILTELQAATPKSPLLLFDKIKGYEPGYRVASNLFTTPRRIALGLGLPLEARGMELVKAMREKMKAGIKLLPPVEVETGPVKENVLVGDEVNLFRFPAPRWHELDGGRYIGTGSMTIMRDPDEGWVNAGTYRTEIHDRNTATMHIVLGHHGAMIRQRYWDRGLNCPVAVACGQEPALWAASTWEHVPWGTSEYDFAGGLKGEPVHVTKGVTTDLPIPTTAEIVLEGELLRPEIETRQEGPFGEWAGYYAGGTKTMPVFKVKSILHRNNCIIQGNPPSRFPAMFTLGRHIQKAAALWDELDRQMPGVKGAWMIEDAAIHSIPVISIKQSYPGHAKQAALVTAGCNATGLYSRMIIVVDDDIDPSNTSEVLWALGTRTDPKTSIDIIGECWGGSGDPLLPPGKRKTGDYTMSRALILACKPYSWIKEFPPSIRTSPELTKKTMEKWKWLF